MLGHIRTLKNASTRTRTPTNVIRQRINSRNCSKSATENGSADKSKLAELFDVEATVPNQFAVDGTHSCFVKESKISSSARISCNSGFL